MQIREDFKYDPESWIIEAKQLLKKSMNMILFICVLFPAVLLFSANYLSLFAGVQFPAGIAAIAISIMYAALTTLIFSPSFYLLYFFKKIDFQIKTGLFAILSGIKSTIKGYFSVVKEHRTFMLFPIISTFVIGFLTYASVISSNKIEEFTSYSSIFQLLSSSTGLLPVAFLWTFAILKKRLLGLVYIGYDVVNAEGSHILTKMAYSKFPEIENYVMGLTTKLNMYFLLLIGVKLVLAKIITGIEVGYVISTFFNCIYIMFSSYALAIIYIISRDLYGGKQQKQKVTVTEDVKNIVPDLI